MTYDTVVETAEIEDLIAAVGERHGFRIRDYSLVWDGDRFDMRRAIHTLDIVANNGRHARAELSHAALSDSDPWKHLRRVDAAFQTLARRRARERGI
jgi:hypothetical protein